MNNNIYIYVPPCSLIPHPPTPGPADTPRPHGSGGGPLQFGRPQGHPTQKYESKYKAVRNSD